MPRLAPTSLTGRLVVTVVALVALVSLLIGTATTLAMRSYLDNRLDDQVDQALDRAMGPARFGAPLAPPDGEPQDDTQGDDGRDGPGDGRRDGDPLGQGAGTLTAFYPEEAAARGNVLTTRGGRTALGTDALALLAGVPEDGRSHEVDLPGLGEYRIQAEQTTQGTLVAGLPTEDVTDIIASLVAVELLLAALGVGLAGGTGFYLVRRQLRPLREVAATAHEVSTLPLSSGEIGETVRVPEQLTDERTEVGAVGAALNTMLEHVEHALDERHRSELQVRQFVADASHELRTPLSTIHGYAELSRRTQPTDPDAQLGQLTHAMSKVESEATRMSSLVEDLLLLARLDAGRPLIREEVDLTRLVLETVGDARVVGPDHKWLLDLPDEPLEVTGDEQRLHQVVTNLLNNARRHTPPGTSVIVGVRADPACGDEVVLTVQDNGPGMSPELARTAFERFTRGDSARTRESGGAGLGLSLVEAITTAHGGSASVRSEPGRTCFEVRLPAHSLSTDPAHG